jgi:hypothetical protein
MSLLNANEATYIKRARMTSAFFRKIGQPDEMINVIGSYGDAEIADTFAPKDGAPGEAYVVGNVLYIWDAEQGFWICGGEIGDKWERVHPHNILEANRPGLKADLLHEAEMKAWVPAADRTGVVWFIDHVYTWDEMYTCYRKVGPMVDLKGSTTDPAKVTDDFLHELYMSDVRANYQGTFEAWKLQNHDISGLLKKATGTEGLPSAIAPVRETALTNEEILAKHFSLDVGAGYGGTYGEWCSQNGDLNAVLRSASGYTAQDPDHLEYVRRLEEQRMRIHQRDILADAKEHPSLDDVSSLLEGALQKLEGEESDAAFKALDALKKVKVDLRRKRRNTWLRWLLFWAIVGGAVYGLYKWLPTQVVSGHYTVPKTCSVPFGNGLIQGMRYYNYSYKSLFGVHFTLESTVREETDVTKNGQEFTIFGLSPRNEAATEEEMALADKALKAAEVEVEGAPKPPKGKWWRINVWSSDKGTQWMKPAELYLFASEKYTTMVAYKDFCK